MFKRDCYVKVVDTSGNYRFGYIAGTQERGFILNIDLSEEGLSKINYDAELMKNTEENWYEMNKGNNDFNNILTETEKKMIPLLAQYKSTNNIAKEMGIAPATVRVHIMDLKNKLNLDTREQLFAYSQGIEKKLT